MTRILWHSGFYDGPLSGMCLYNDEKHWFRLHEENEDTGDRTFEIIKPTPEQLKIEEDRHALFQAHVGIHTDYDENGKRPIGAIHPQSEHHKFYDVDRVINDFSKNEVVCILTESELRNWGKK